jgi:hypothetical protein
VVVAGTVVVVFGVVSTGSVVGGVVVDVVLVVVDVVVGGTYPHPSGRYMTTSQSVNPAAVGTALFASAGAYVDAPTARSTSAPTS